MSHPSAPQTVTSSAGRPIVVGLYGLSGCGKSFLLQQLEGKLGKDHFLFIDGSEVIDEVTPNGLEAFQTLDHVGKERYRQRAIVEIGRRSSDSGKVAVVTGHFIFWPEAEEHGTEAWTDSDSKIYTHILYLDVPASIVANRREMDKERHRPKTSVAHLERWRQAEISKLRSRCLESGILFSVMSESQDFLCRISILLQDFRIHNEEHNLSILKKELDQTFVDKDHVEIVLVLDADRTLAAEDTGLMFWTAVGFDRGVLKAVFDSPMLQSYKAFRQAMLLYEERAEDFVARCEDVAAAVTMYPQFIALLKHVESHKSVEAIILTSGLRLIWQLILQREGLSKSVKVIGGGRLADGFVVSGSEKRALVERLQKVHGKYVWAFGDSPLDLGMLCQANQAIIAVGDEKTRSKSMDVALRNAIDNGLVARQVVLSEHASPRADTEVLPVIKLTDHAFLDSITRRRRTTARTASRVFHATEARATQLLMTPMRDARVSGPALREAHRLVGRYLSTTFVADVVGLERYSIRHVQGHKIDGFRLANEDRTVLVALMRGGEPMAQGVNDVFPHAMLVHAKLPEDLKPHHLEGRNTVILIDSVVNTGKSIVDFVRHIRKQQSTVMIVVVAGVVQAQSVTHGDLAGVLAEDKNLRIITLRLSENKFTGKKTTDTGNRLFNTTQLD